MTTPCSIPSSTPSSSSPTHRNPRHSVYLAVNRYFDRLDADEDTEAAEAALVRRVQRDPTAPARALRAAEQWLQYNSTVRHAYVCDLDGEAAWSRRERALRTMIDIILPQPRKAKHAPTALVKPPTLVAPVSTTSPSWLRVVRVGDLPMAKLPYLETAATVHALLAPYAAVEDVEVMWALFLDSDRHLLGGEEVARGSVGSVSADHGQAFRLGIVLGASYVIFAHNHPDGDPTPSPQDRRMTRQAIRAGDLLGIKVLDELVVTRDSWRSILPTKRAPRTPASRNTENVAQTA